MNIFIEISKLLDYAIQNNFIKDIDRIYFRNIIMDTLGINEWEEIEYIKNVEEYPHNILNNILNYAIENKIIEDGITSKDLFDSKIMGLLTPFPSTVVENIQQKISKGKLEEATNYFYRLSQKNNYIRTDRIKKNIYFTSNTEYGDLEITINLSKPEKDPKEIARQKIIKENTSYPKCLLCYENMGYAGNYNHPARQNLRLFPLNLNGENWYMQYSPYVYYNEHCIVFCNKHRPMVIDKNCISRLLDFVDIFKHYFIGSNADLPIVGGSILSHDHYQGGRHEFPMAKSKIETKIIFKNFENVNAGIVKWPLSVIRLSSENKKDIINLSDKIMKAWRKYTDESLGIISESLSERHSTITPIARRRDNYFELDIVLRNNRTDETRPLGIYHPRSDYHNIKRENIGVIEVMGLAVLPGRLEKEMLEIAKLIKKYEADKLFDEMEKDIELEKHKNWLKSFYFNYIREIQLFSVNEIIKNILYKEIGLTFSKCLEDSGVFKRNEEGKKGFLKFIDFVNNFKEEECQF